MSRKKSSPFSPRGNLQVALQPPNLSSGETVELAAYSGYTRQLTVCVRRLDDLGSFDAFGSGSYASRRVGSKGPTMVLSVTRGLQLFLVMRGAYGDSGGSVLNDSNAVPNSSIDTLPRPQASLEPIG